MAAEVRGVVYFVDSEDGFTNDPSNNPLLDWRTYRTTTLPSDYDSDSGTNLEEGTINVAANLLDSMIVNAINRSGGIGSGRHVALLGDDAIIPFYRVYDSSGTVLSCAGAP